MRNVIIIGGGLSGLITGIQLVNSGIRCMLIEKKSYPFHRVCGEYISNEAVPFLKLRGLYPDEFSPPQIARLLLSSVLGRKSEIPLDLGGFGISRYTFDDYLFRKAKAAGVEFMLETEVTGVVFDGSKFTVQTTLKNFETNVVVGAFGKRSRLDAVLDRPFFKQRSPYVGIKYHIRTDHPDHLIALHNFQGGYCGVSNIEEGKTNLCYLTHRDNLRNSGDIPAMEHEVLFKNPLIKSVFSNSKFLFDKPEVINEISFETKSAVANHVLMAGDAAGMITPLCGNGMAMAIHSAKLLSEVVAEYCNGKVTREVMETKYGWQWNKVFRQRIWKGRQVQKLFGYRRLSDFAVNLAIYSRPIANVIVRNTHGEVF